MELRAHRINEMTTAGRLRHLFWDRNVGLAEFVATLNDPSQPEHLSFMAHLLREGRPDDVWAFTSPAVVAAEWAQLAPRLGRRRPFWEWLLAEWRRLGLLP